MQESNNILQAIPELEGEVSASLFAGSVWWSVLAWALLIVAIFIAIGIIWHIRRSRQQTTPAPSPLDTALSALTSLEEKMPPVRESSQQLSLILRRFLQGQVQDPALYETHEEFSQRLDALSSVPEQCQYDTRYLLETLADLKYAGLHEQNPVRVRTLIEQTRSLIMGIHDAQQPIVPPDSIEQQPIA